jgi:hypothetical protein
MQNDTLSDPRLPTVTSSDCNVDENPRRVSQSGPRAYDNPTVSPLLAPNIDLLSLPIEGFEVTVDRVARSRSEGMMNSDAVASKKALPM